MGFSEWGWWWWGDSGESWTQASPVLSHPTHQLFEFDSTNTSDVAAEPPGKPYPPYSLAEFSWNNITDSLDPATLSATFRGHPNQDSTRAFANGSLTFRVRAWEPEELKRLSYEGGS